MLICITEKSALAEEMLKIKRIVYGFELLGVVIYSTFYEELKGRTAEW